MRHLFAYVRVGYFKMTMNKVESVKKLLTHLYYELNEPGSFMGINVLYGVAKKYLPTIKRKEVENFLNNQHVYLRHRRPRKPKSTSYKFPKFVVSAPNINWACDSAVFKHSKLLYATVCRDSFTGKVFVASQKNLKAETTLKNLKNIVQKQNKGIYPDTIFTDRGTEYAQLHGNIPSRHKTTHGRNQKSFLAEETIKVLRAKLNRYRTWTGRKVDFAEALPNLLTSINSTPNSRTGITPNDAEKPKNSGLVFTRKYLPYLNQLKKVKKETKFLPGDFVRIAIPDKNSFLKRSLPGYSQETFTIEQVRTGYPKTYTAIDSSGNKIEGHFHEIDLLRAEPDYKSWRIIDRTLAQRLSKNGKKEYLVNFQGHNLNYKRWLSEKLYNRLKLKFPERNVR